MKQIRLIGILVVIVLLRFVFHVLYVPVFEGPDEPFHLARAAAFADGPIDKALSGSDVPGQIVAAIKANPCGPDLGRAFGCPPFDGSGAAFNVLEGTLEVSHATAAPNYEAHQPPVFYAVAGLVIRLTTAASGWAADPASRLLIVRMFAVVLVGLALLGPLRSMALRRPPVFALAGALCLLSPGAAEALARCANDAAVFLWAACLLWLLERRASTGLVGVLLALGPLIKLTAAPIVAVALVWLWRERGLKRTLLGLGASLAFLPLQWLRGWAWGGTVELNVELSGFDEPVVQSVIGMGRTVYTFVKTIFWLGEWSFFRPPVVLLASAGVVLITWLASLKLRSRRQNLLPHLAGAAVAAGGFLVFAINHRLYFETWGGVGGWYAWGWFPWVLVGVNDLFESRAPLRKVVVALGLLLLLAGNVLWFSSAHSIYGF